MYSSHPDDTGGEARTSPDRKDFPECDSHYVTEESPRHDEALIVPSKAEIIAALQHEGGRGGLQLEWVLDRCDAREGER